MGKKQSKKILAPKSKPLSKKNPRQEQSVDSEQEKPVWQFYKIDWDGPWGWCDIEAQKWQEILAKLGS